MKKRMLYLFLLIFVFFIASFSVNALTPDQLLTRVSECSKIELASANEDGSITKVECYDTYEEAKKIMNETDNDNLVLIEQGVIIDAKYAVIDYEISFPAGHQNYDSIYIDKNSNVTNGAYIKGGTPDDAALLEVDYQTKRAKIKVAGLIGWMNKYDGTLKLYDIVPLAWAKTPQSYLVTNDKITHIFPGNVYGKSGSSLTIDRKPSMLEVGTYYSYDGHYFYTDMKTLLNDYRNNTYEHSVNKDNPYYNYYQYLSFRTKTNYNMENINQYLSKRISDATSKMLNTGQYFINAQDNYGVNAILMMAIGMNESGRGLSPIAQAKNNLFGLNAVDASPGTSADVFATVEDCIYSYAYSWLSYKFLQPGEYYDRYKGANLGNKSQGLNYKYASDPFWGEKAAAYYYDIDSMFGFQDHNVVQIAVLNDNYNNTVYAMKTPGGDYVSKDYYQYKVKDSAVAVVEETQGPSVNGNTTWYKVMSDPTIDDNLNYTGDSKSNPRVKYNWNGSYVYVSAAYFNKVNTPVQAVPSVPPTVPDPSPKEEPNDPKPETPKPKAVSDIVKEANYHYENGIISGITPGTTVEAIKNSLTTAGGEIVITDSNGKEKTTGNIGTGDQVNITSGITERLSVLIYGDSNGDGSIDKLDCAEILRQYYGYIKYDDIRKKSLDINKDGNIDKLDASQVLRHYYGYINIEQ